MLTAWLEREDKGFLSVDVNWCQMRGSDIKLHGRESEEVYMVSYLACGHLHAIGIVLVMFSYCDAV